MKRLPILATLAAALAEPALAQRDAASPHLLVVPLAARSGRVPASAPEKLYAMLLAELEHGGFSVEGAAAARVSPDAQRALERARTALNEAVALRAQHHLPAAAEQLAAARRDLAAAAPALVDAAELADARALEAAVAFARGRDEEGQAHLAAAVALSPARALPLASTSVRFSRLVEQARAQRDAGPTGTLTWHASPEHAPVWLDGRLAGATPLVVKEVPVGSHLWVAALATGERVGGLVDVTAGRTVELRAKPSAEGASARLLDALAENRVPEETARAVAAQAHSPLVLFGALSAEGSGLALDLFVVTAKDEAIRRLPRRRFDRELLSARVEVYALATELARGASALGEPLSSDALVANEGAAPATPMEVRYGAEGAAERVPTADPSASPSSTSPPEPRRRVPLKIQ